MDHTALVFGLWKYFSHSFEHTKAFITDDKPNTVKSSTF